MSDSPSDTVPVWLTYPSESLLPRSYVEKYTKALHDLNNSKQEGKPMISVKLLNPLATLPTRSYHSAGYDLYACEEIDCKPGSVTMIPIGIATSFPAGHAALVWDRSGMGKKGFTIFGGVIDEDYRGEWFVMLYNSTCDTYTVRIGDRVGQFVLQEVKQVPIAVVEELTDTERGENGFSSTGR